MTVSVDEYSEDHEASGDADMISPASSTSEKVLAKYLRKSYRRRGNRNASLNFAYKQGAEIVGKRRHARLVPHSGVNTPAGVETTE